MSTPMQPLRPATLCAELLLTNRSVNSNYPFNKIGSEWFATGEEY